MQVTTATVRGPSPPTCCPSKGIQGMTVLITILGLINLDFADVCP